MPRPLHAVLAPILAAATLAGCTAGHHARPDPAGHAHHAGHAAGAGPGTAGHGATPVPDAREAVRFPPALRAHTLANMRDHLAALAEIQQALADGRLDAAADTAERRLGMSSLHDHGAHEVARFMPPAMQAAGTAMHRSASRFAVAARDSGATGDLRNAQAALAGLTQTCVTCHAGFRLE